MRKRPYKVFLLITDFSHGGSERQFVEVATRLDPARFHVTVGCIARRGTFAERLQAQGCDIQEFRFPSLASAQAARQALRLASRLRAQGTDVVHAFDFYTNLFGLPAARLARVPVVLASRRDTGDVWSPPRRFALRLAYRLADAVVVNSEAARRGLWAEGFAERRVRLLRNGVDLEQFSANGNRAEVVRRLGLPGNGPWVATVSMLRAEKDHESLLAAVPRVIRRVPSARFLIVGAGPTEARLRALVASQGLTDSVLFLGDRGDIPELLQAVDVFVLPSLTESFPNALLEAMSMSLPVVATTVGGVPELVEPGRTGYLVPPRRSELLADRIAFLLERPDLRAAMGRAARTRVEAQFDIRQAVKRFEDLYEEMLEEKGRA